MRLVKERASSLSGDKSRELVEMILASKRAEVTTKFFKRADKWKDFYRGKQWPTGADKENRMVINLVYSFVKTLLPTIYFQDPTIKAEATAPAYEGLQETWELVTNNSLPKIGFSKAAKAVLLDAILGGEGWWKLVYNKGEDDPEDGGGRGSGAVTEAQAGAVPWLRRNLPFYVRHPMQRVIVDRLAKDRDLDNARWVALEYFKPLDEMRKDPRYKVPSNIDSSKLIGMGQSMATDEPLVSATSEISGASGAVREEDSLVRFWEVYVYQLVGMRLYRQMVVVSDISNEPLRQPVSWDELVGRDISGWPLKRLVFNPVPDDVPMSDIEAWSTLQQGLNWAFSMVINHLETQTDVRMFHSDRVKNPAKEMARIQNDKPAVAYVEVTGDGAIENLGTPRVSPDMYRAIDAVVRFADIVSGQDSLRQGDPQNVRTAAQVQVITAGAQVKINEKVRTLHDFLKESIEAWIASVKATLGDDTDFIIRVAGDTGQVAWKQFSVDDINWMPDIAISVNSFRDKNRQEDLQMWSMVMSWAMELFPLLGPVMRIDKILSQAMRAAGVDNPRELLGDLIDEAVLQMAEIVRMVHGEQVPVDPEDGHDKHIEQLNNYMNSDLFEQGSEETQQYIIQHRAAHLQMKMQLAEQAQSLNGSRAVGSNLMDANPESLSPENEGRRIAANIRSGTEADFGKAGSRGATGA